MIVTSSDYIASGALIISLISLGYSIYSANKSEKKNNQKEKLDFIKLLSKSLRKISYQDNLDQKLVKQGEIIDELNCCFAFIGEEKYIQFREDFDAKVYLVINASNAGDFNRSHQEGISMIDNFRKEYII